ncbi:hypothetical protein CUMW_001640 [Citrus unshiu]|nr:hypothetical protein CUMW_001640 [Citrus unshiu]
MELNSKRKSKQDSEDGISHLSHPIPCHILSFLPTKHAVATCILSSRWKFVCASLSNLCFRNQLREAPAINNHIVCENFVNRVSRLTNSATLCKFSLHCFKFNDLSILKFWIEIHVDNHSLFLSRALRLRSS